MKCDSFYLRCLFGLAFVLPSTCFATSLFSEDAYYNAQQAAYIQVGLAAFVGNLQKYGETQAVHFAVSVGADKVIGPTVYGYKVFRERSVTIPWDNKRIRLAPYNISLELPL